VTGIGDDGSLILGGRGRDREVPAEYAARFVELAYATTVHGAQGDTVDHAHVVIGETTGAAAAYVAMTRGRQNNTAHLVADTLEDARAQWTETFGRDRADLGPAHARTRALDDLDRYGPAARSRTPPRGQVPPWPEPRPTPAPDPAIGL
jgi:exodeoxyribonuclease V alpha subunit